MAHPIKALLSLYDEAYQRKFGVPAPIVGGKDAKLAVSVMRYTLEQHAQYLEAFFASTDTFIQRSGYTFGVYVSCIGKVIAAAVPSARPIPPVPMIELAKSIARANAEQAEHGRAWIQQREATLIAQGCSAEAAKFTAGREWLRK